MQHLHKIGITVVFLLGALSAQAQLPKIIGKGAAAVGKGLPGQVVRAGVPGGVSGGALGVMDSWVLPLPEVKKAVDLSLKAAQAVVHPPTYPPAVLTKREFLNSDFFTMSIAPTPVEKLYPRLTSPSSAQMQGALEEYQNALSDFFTLRKEIQQVLLYQNLPGESGMLLPESKRGYLEMLWDIRLRINRLALVTFPKDQALQSAKKWLDDALQKFNPYYTPENLMKEIRADREFDRGQFLLADDWRNPLLPHDFKREVPENIHMAVLNDDLDILAMYDTWIKQGRLGKNWTLETYHNTEDLVAAVKSGKNFDLIITDLTVPGGGGYFLTDQVRQLNKRTPIIGCSMYTIDAINAEKMFEQGFDGYIYGGGLFEEVSGSVTWMGYIKYYYSLGKFFNWRR